MIRWLVVAIIAVALLILLLADKRTDRAKTERNPAENTSANRTLPPEDTTPAAPKRAGGETAPEKATLTLELRNRATGLPAQCSAELWRLGERDMMAGRGRVFAGLTPGHYRCVVLGQRAGTPDPPAFLVEAPRTTHVIHVPLPRMLSTVLVVTDHRGRPVRRGSITRAVRFEERRVNYPAWVRGVAGERTPVSSASTSEGSPVAVTSPNGRYRLKDLLESTREVSRESMEVFATEGHSHVNAKVRGERDAPRRLHGVVVPHNVLLALVFLPDGTPAEAKLDEAYCYAVPLDQAPVVNVQVSVKGLRPLRFEYDPRDPPERVVPTTEPTRPPK